MEQYYRIKTIPFLSSYVNILCQQENGPCPLLAVANALILLKRLSIAAGIDRISSSSLLNALANVALEQYKTETSISTSSTGHNGLDGASLEAQRLQHIQEVIQMLPRLLVGMDVNVYFHGVDQFEYTQEMAVFDAYGVHLYHGWVGSPPHPCISTCTSSSGSGSSSSGSTGPTSSGLVDPIISLGPISYNHLITQLVHAKERRDAISIHIHDLCPNPEQFDPLPESIASIETEIAGLSTYISEIERFLSETSSQLTLFGLESLREAMNNNQVAVFFRNNHFSTILKFDNRLYLLVTDEGYVNESNIVWERLDDVLGNNDLVDGYFTTFSHVAAASSPPFQHSDNITTSTAPMYNSSDNAATDTTAFGTVCAPPMRDSGSSVSSYLSTSTSTSTGRGSTSSTHDDGAPFAPTILRPDQSAYTYDNSNSNSISTSTSVNNAVEDLLDLGSAPPITNATSTAASSTTSANASNINFYDTDTTNTNTTTTNHSADATTSSNITIDTEALQRSLGTVTQAFDVAAATAKLYRNSNSNSNSSSISSNNSGSAYSSSGNNNRVEGLAADDVCIEVVDGDDSNTTNTNTNSAKKAYATTTSPINSNAAATSTYGDIASSADDDRDYILALQLQEQLLMQAEQQQEERMNRDAAEAIMRNEMLGSAGGSNSSNSSTSRSGTGAATTSASVPVDVWADPAVAQFADDPLEAERLVRSQEWILKNIQAGGGSSSSTGGNAGGASGTYDGGSVYDYPSDVYDDEVYAAQTNMRTNNSSNSNINNRNHIRRNNKNNGGGCAIS